MPWLWKPPKPMHCHSGSIPRKPHRKPRHKSGAKPFCSSQRAPTVEVASVPKIAHFARCDMRHVFDATDGGVLKWGILKTTPWQHYTSHPFSSWMITGSPWLCKPPHVVVQIIKNSWHPQAIPGSPGLKWQDVVFRDLHISCDTEGTPVTGPMFLPGASASTQNSALSCPADTESKGHTLW